MFTEILSTLLGAAKNEDPRYLVQKPLSPSLQTDALLGSTRCIFTGRRGDGGGN